MAGKRRFVLAQANNGVRLYLGRRDRIVGKADKFWVLEAQDEAFDGEYLQGKLMSGLRTISGDGPFWTEAAAIEHVRRYNPDWLTSYVSGVEETCALCEEPMLVGQDFMVGYDPMESLSGPVMVHAECGIAEGLVVA